MKAWSPTLITAMDLGGAVLIAILLAALLVAIARRLLSSQAQGARAFRLWFGGALSTFIAGCVEGAPAGTTGGGLIAIADGAAQATTFSPRPILIDLLHVIAVPFLNGIADLKPYIKANPFPNIFASDAPNPPASPTPPPAGSSGH